METFKFEPNSKAIELRKNIKTFGNLEGKDLAQFVKFSEEPPKFKYFNQNEIDEPEEPLESAHYVFKSNVEDFANPSVGDSSIYVPPCLKNVKTTIKIINIPLDIREKAALFELLNTGVKVHPIGVHIVLNPESKESRGLAFVTFSSLEEAKEAIQKIDGFVVENNLLGAELAKKKENMEKERNDENSNKKGESKLMMRESDYWINKNKTKVYFELKKITLYKTEMCRNFEETGFCQYTEKCQFAHSINELREKERHPLYKTTLCKKFLSDGYCPYGKRCCFIHDNQKSSNIQTDGIENYSGSEISQNIRLDNKISNEKDSNNTQISNTKDFHSTEICNDLDKKISNEKDSNNKQISITKDFHSTEICNDLDKKISNERDSYHTEISNTNDFHSTEIFNDLDKKVSNERYSYHTQILNTKDFYSTEICNDLDKKISNVQGFNSIEIFNVSDVVMSNVKDSLYTEIRNNSDINISNVKKNDYDCTTSNLDEKIDNLKAFNYENPNRILNGKIENLKECDHTNLCCDSDEFFIDFQKISISGENSKNTKTSEPFFENNNLFKSQRENNYNKNFLYKNNASEWIENGFSLMFISLKPKISNQGARREKAPGYSIYSLYKDESTFHPIIL